MSMSRQFGGSRSFHALRRSWQILKSQHPSLFSIKFYQILKSQRPSLISIKNYAKALK
jgi:hypothetical protein